MVHTKSGKKLQNIFKEGKVDIAVNVGMKLKSIILLLLPPVLLLTIV